MYYRFISTARMPDLLDVSTVSGYARVDGDDSILNQLLRAAMAWAEGFCDQPLFERVHTVELSNYAGGILPGISPRNVQVDFTATNGEPNTWGPFTSPAPGDAFQVSPLGSVSFLPGLVSPLFGTKAKISYVAGWNSEDYPMPDDVVMALCLVANNLYNNRDNAPSEKRTAAENMLQPYKRY